MSLRNLRVNPKDYKLNVSDEVLKNMNPVFEVSSSSFHRAHLEKEKEKGGQMKSTSGHEGKTLIDVRLRDAKSGELLGKGHIEYDENDNKPEKYEEKVCLKDVFGNTVGEALVDIEEKKNLSTKGIDDEFRQMRREIGHMMRETNRIFDRFSRRYYGKDWGFGLLDDFRPMLMFDEPWMTSPEGIFGSDQGRIEPEPVQQAGVSPKQQSVGSQSSSHVTGTSGSSGMSGTSGKHVSGKTREEPMHHERTKERTGMETEKPGMGTGKTTGAK